MTSNRMASPGSAAVESDPAMNAARFQSVEEMASVGRFTDSCRLSPDRHQSPAARVEI